MREIKSSQAFWNIVIWGGIHALFCSFLHLSQTDVKYFIYMDFYSFTQVALKGNFNFSFLHNSEHADVFLMPYLILGSYCAMLACVTSEIHFHFIISSSVCMWIFFSEREKTFEYSLISTVTDLSSIPSWIAQTIYLDKLLNEANNTVTKSLQEAIEKLSTVV